MIFHLVPLADWTAAPGLPYAPPSLESEGFVHCSADRPTALEIADSHYRAVPGTLLAVELDEDALRAEVRREGGSGGRYPHVHGPLNREAVIRVWEVVRTPGTPASLSPWEPGNRNGAADFT
ncbi:DUF952 domain-containing protein [Streptomyces sp. NBC_00162]|uniref:DUF952 domain-containing protein n=1 Tax=Streptomyces sp. NBC_00162 TaxID=2903629 RepID=UPI00214CB2F8|nr:DUF952 domain-containing protein [Streptomyces sp. NBC_00162]UUU42722.1 DUF952 domain-containing protein [Streptomyces sp. NBC_00162]